MVLRLIQNARKIHGKHEDHYSSKIELLVDYPYLSYGARNPKVSAKGKQKSSSQPSKTYGARNPKMNLSLPQAP
jgi:hypothetical protein